MIWLFGCVVAVVDLPRPPPDVSLEPDVVVDCNGNADFTTIADAIAASPSGTRIGLSPCTYAEDVDFGAKTLVLFGLDGSAATILDGTGDGSVVRAAHGQSFGTTLAGVTITGGSGDGAAVSLEGGFLSMSDVVLTDNRGGSVIAVDGGMLDATDVAIHDNSPYDAVIYADNASVMLQRATIACDGAPYGVLNHAPVILLDTTISCGDGMGVYAAANDIHVRRSRIESTSYAIYGADAPDTRNERLWLYNSALVGGDTAVFAQYLHVKVENSVIWGDRVGLQLDQCHVESKVRDSVLVGEECGLKGDGFAYDVAWDAVATTCDAEGADLVTADPAFVDPPTDLHPAATSPLVDGGDPEKEDYDGSRRDIGVYGGPGGDGEP